MKRVTTAIVGTIALSALVFACAWAQQTVGGHDETSEVFNPVPVGWNAAAGQVATPGVVAGAVGTHLLITEVGWRGLNNATCADSTEFIEIYNPTSLTVDLSKYYVCDVNAYYTLPVAGTINIAASSTDFAMKFPAGASILPGGVKVIAIDGGRYKRCVGTDADFMFFNAGGATTAQFMVDVATNKPVPYPTYGSFTNGGEFVWLFYWNGYDDLVCDVDLVSWGAPTAANIPTLKTVAMCQDGPDVDVLAQCYRADLGPITYLAAPASGSGTRQRIGAETETTPIGGGNGCVPGTPTPATKTTWGQMKVLYR